MASTRDRGASDGVYTRLGLALVDSVQDFWGRSLEIGGRYVRNGLADASVASDGAPASADLVGAFLREFRHYATEMALVPWLALERFGDRLRSGDHLEEPGAPSYDVDDGHRLALPVRVLDSAQGMALYAVPARAVEALLTEAGVPLEPVDLGRGQTGLSIFGVHHREGDLIQHREGDPGTYDEVGVAFLVAPPGDPLAIGLYIIDFPVSRRFPFLAGKVIWGYAKSEATVEMVPGTSQVTWRLTRKDASQPILTITFPRGGGGASTAIPFLTYTLTDTTPPTVIRTVLTRTGRGERIRTHGRGVKLELGDPAANAGDPLWKILYDLGVAGTPPMIQAWTEHMAAEFGRPVTLRRRPQSDSPPAPRPNSVDHPARQTSEARR